VKKRFTRENDIVVDNEKGLMWQDDDSVNNRIDWNHANAMASQLRLGNYNDWRLPSLDELLSIANKNNVPQLDNIFINRPFSTWSALESENKQTAMAIFYDDMDIVSSIHSSADRKDSKLFVRYVRDIEKINNSEYETDVNNLTCTCKNWTLLRSQFPIDDPRRLCKHLIKKIDINKMDNNLNRYKYEIEFYKNKNSGFPDDFNTLIDIEGTSYKLLYKHQNQSWMSFFDSDGTKYGVMHENYERVVWTNLYGKPHDYAKVEKYFNQLTVKLPLGLQEYEKNELIFYVKAIIPGKKDSSFRIEEDQYIPTPSHIYYSAGEDNDNIHNIIDNEIRWIVVKNDVMIIEMYNGKEYSIARDCGKLKLIEENIKINKEKERLQREADEVKRKLEYEEYIINQREKAFQKGYLYEIKDTHFHEVTKNMNNEEAHEYYLKYYEFQDKILSQFSTAKEMLNITDSTLSIAIFHKILKKLNMITKVEELNLNDWILINKGLDYGINFIKDSKYFSPVVPEWYEIKTIDPHLLELVNETDRANVRMTKILWKKDKFSELIELINQSIESNSNQKIVPIKSKRQLERELWLESIQCPSCNSKNIHKKNRRTYGYGEVQRYQCMDCNKIFQEVLKGE